MMLCTGGLDVRARADASASGDFFPVAVEYHHAGLDHYFVATMAQEIADLDGSVHPGWQRTGAQFRIFVNDPSWPSSQSVLNASCRYYGLPAYGLNSHFFSAFADECAAVSTHWPDRWLLETSQAFRAHVPNPATGACPSGTVPLFRLFNNRADANHRYTVSHAIRRQMIDRAWIPEGHGPLGVAMCVRDF
jgi:serine protease